MAGRPRKPTAGISDPIGTVVIDGNVSGGGDGDGDIGGAIIIDPTEYADAGGTPGGSSADSGSVAGSPVAKRRGRKPGSSNRAKGAALDISGLGNIILNFHVLLAAVTRAEELLMDKEEADKLADATAKVARHYNVEIAAKTTDWINLAIVAGGVYVPRVAAIRMRVASDRGRNRPARQHSPAPQPGPAPETARVVVSEAPPLGELDAFGFPVTYQ